MTDARGRQSLMSQHDFDVWLNITSQQYLNYYRGHATHVSATDDQGRTIQFPANILRPYLTQSGIAGHFRLRCDAANRLMTIEKISVISDPYP